MTQSLRRAAGSAMVVGISGTELTGLERAWLKLIRPAGVILFQRSIHDAAQTRALLAQATEQCCAAQSSMCRRGRRNGGPAAELRLRPCLRRKLCLRLRRRRENQS